MILRKHFKNIGLFMMVSCAVFSQDRRLSKANANFEDYAFIDARKRYLQVVKNGHISADIYKKLGDSYYFNGEPEEALKWYEKLAAEYAEETNMEYLFRYVQCLKGAERYKEADEMTEKFSAVIPNDNRAKLFSDTGGFLEFIATQSGKFDIRRLAVNTEYSEYAPSYDHRGRLVFASSRPAGILSRKVHRWNELSFSDLFSLDET
ncbi:MAG: hypothetical protein KDD04_04635, partial [Sinomicrobium sp.]|nr:hypothetical protein [Sinomicrobium sp.]